MLCFSPAPLRLGVTMLLLSGAPTRSLALDNGVGRLPVMGWNSWNYFKDKLDEDVVRATASELVSTGLASKGYRYVNMDDCWASPQRSTDGHLVPDPAKFPNTMSKLVADVHDLGLKFGIYTDVGYKTCGKRAGSLGHETQDAEQFAAWGVDFVKSDSCFTDANASVQPADGQRCYALYEKFEAALNATGRAMVHSVKGPCGRFGQECSPSDASSIANLRRAAGDVHDNWDSILRVLEKAADVVNASKPGFFADLDILEIGNGGLTQTEERSVFTLWCATKSPLLLGNNLSAMSAETLATVSNSALISVNQDKLGVAAQRVINSTSGLQVWTGPLSPQLAYSSGDASDHVVVAFNAGNNNVTTWINWTEVGVCRSNKGYSGDCAWDVRNLWTNAVSVAVTRGLRVSLLPHSATALRLENMTNPNAL